MNDMEVLFKSMPLHKSSEAFTYLDEKENLYQEEIVEAIHKMYRDGTDDGSRTIGKNHSLTTGNLTYMYQGDLRVYSLENNLTEHQIVPLDQIKVKIELNLVSEFCIQVKVIRNFIIFFHYLTIPPSICLIL